MRIEKKTKNILIVIAMLLIAVIVYFFAIGQSNRNWAHQLTQAERDYLNEHQTLIYSADNNSPPLRYVDPDDGQYKGVVIDYVNVLSLKLGVNIAVHPQVWELALESLQNSESDMCDMFASEERSEHFLFTEPIYNLRGVVVTRFDDRPIEELRFATQKGDYLNEWLLEHYPQIEITMVEDVASALDLLIEGQVDAVAGDEPVVLYQIKEKEAEDILEIRETPLYENPVVFAIPKDEPELLNILNKGIASIDEEGQLESIQQKWFGISTPIVQLPDESERLRLIIIGAAILGLVVIAMVVWNYSLSREVEKRTREVISSKNDLQITFDGMNESIVLFDTNLDVVNINRAMAGALKIEKNKLIGQPYHVILERFGIDELVNIVKQVHSEGRSLEKELHQRGTYFLVKAYPLDDSLGNIKNVLLVMQNNTREKLTERQLAQSSKMAAIGQLAAGMGHEIRNPLGIIRNHSYMLRNSGDEKITRSLDYIDGAVERARRIIDNLLEFSRLTDDKMETVDVHRLIQQLLDLEHKALLKRGIECRFECDEPLSFWSNTDALRHVMINLISNAADAIGENGDIEVRCELEDDSLLLSVSDSGQGIPEDQLEQIFNPFFTTKAPDKGTGLGLYIVYNEVKKLGGEIEVNRSSDHRTVFEIRLPDREGRDANA